MTKNCPKCKKPLIIYDTPEDPLHLETYRVAKCQKCGIELPGDSLKLNDNNAKKK